MILRTFLVLQQRRLNTRLPNRFGGNHLSSQCCFSHTILMFRLVGHYMNNKHGNWRSRSFDHLVWCLYLLILRLLCSDLVMRQNKLLSREPFLIQSVHTWRYAQQPLLCVHDLWRTAFAGCRRAWNWNFKTNRILHTGKCVHDWSRASFLPENLASGWARKNCWAVV